MGQNSWLPPCEVDNPRRMRSNFCSRRYFDQYTRYAKQPWRIFKRCQELLVHSPKARVKDSVWSEFVQIIRRRPCNEVAARIQNVVLRLGAQHMKSGSRKPMLLVMRHGNFWALLQCSNFCTNELDAGSTDCKAENRRRAGWPGWGWQWHMTT